MYGLIFLLASFEFSIAQNIFWINSTFKSKHVSQRLNKELDIYCYPGIKSRFKYILSSAKIQWKFYNARAYFKISTGDNVTSVIHQTKKYSFFDYQSHMHSHRYKLFQPSCLGVYTNGEYKISFEFLKYDAKKLFLLLVGIFFLLMSPILCRNEFFYYLSGIILGNVLSLVILMYFLSKLIPQRKGLSLAMLAGGWSMTAYVVNYILQNIQILIMKYYSAFVIYFLVTSLASLAFCYYKGLPTNPKIINIIKWMINGISMIFMYFALINFKEISFIIPIILTLTHRLIISSTYHILNYPKRKLYLFFLKCFPPKVKFLSQEEYKQQAEHETKRQLEQLKQYCKSSKCVPWKLTQRLKNPSKFASFIEGDSHVDLNETQTWEQEVWNRSAPIGNSRKSYYCDTSDSSPQITDDDDSTN